MLRRSLAVLSPGPAALVALSLACAVSEASPPVMTSMGVIAAPGGEITFTPDDITDLGVVVGTGFAFSGPPLVMRYTPALGIEIVTSGFGSGVSADGRTIAVSPNDSTSSVSRWTTSGQTIVLPQIFSAAGISNDATVIVGGDRIWRSGVGDAPIPLPPGATGFSADAISANGQTVAGLLSFNNPTPQAVMLENGVVVGNLSALLPRGFVVRALSADGTTMIALVRVTDTSPISGVRYHRSGVVTIISLPPGAPATANLFVNAISGDGSIIVGDLDTNPTSSFIWTQSTGSREFTSAISQMGTDLSAWSAMRATAISESGRYIAGTGSRQYAPGLTRREAWIIDLSPPETPVCNGDADRSGAVNFGDITTVLANFGNACP